jgi:hypothetical protein
MAYVRKTDMLIDGIRQKVRDMKRQAQGLHQSNAVEYGTPEFDAFRDAAETAAWEDAPEFRGKLPKEWLLRKNQVTIRIKDASSHTSLQLRMPNDEHIVFPKGSRVDDSYSCSVNVLPHHCNTIARQWLDSAVDRARRYEETGKQFDEVERQLMAYMQRHGSLNTAIKEMPELEMYVPEEFLRKLRAASAPRSKKSDDDISNVEDLGIDANALAAAAIAHRIATASSH